MKYKLVQISPEDIEFNPRNPRRESPEDILNDETFEQLKDSVHKYGVLVPVVVHEVRTRGRHYRLVDGERRVRAALATGTPTIPAHVATKEDGLSELEQAFHIHMLREQWHPVAQARALKNMIKQLRKRYPTLTPKELQERVQEVTGYSDDRFKTLMRAVRYPERVLAEVDRGELSWSHLIQIEESFLDPVYNQCPNLSKAVSKEKARRILVTKAREKTLTNTRALMNNITSVLARAETQAEKTYVENLLSSFLNKPDMTAEEVRRQYETRFPESGKDTLELGNLVVQRASELNSMLKRIQLGRLDGFPGLSRDMKNALKELKKLVGNMLPKLERATKTTI